MNRRSLDGSRIIVEFAGERRERRRGPSSKDVCYNCGKTGHWANECEEGDWRDKCYKCGGFGHVKKDCPSSRSRSPKRHRSRSREKSPSPKQPSPQQEEQLEEYEA
mmetsp:Transcript_10474/g.15674  ORF Transcript_10474/g.15674 Transcript_10474/m.15674 type:complete len:106 (+) Transcript_10474:207-524(+)